MRRTRFDEKDVQSAIDTFLFEVKDELTKKWIKHPEFKQKILETSNNEKLRPYLVVTNIWEGSYEEDMKMDLERWNRG